MTALTQLRESARQEGLEAKSLEIARNMLIQLHLGIDLVEQATGLDTAALKRLQQEADQQS